MLKVFGLIGKTLSHSFSEVYFTEKFKTRQLNCKYTLFELPHLEHLTNLFRNFNTATQTLVGLNVTIPYKSAIIPLLDGLSNEAAAIGAVNTLVLTPNGWIGHNTDVIGFWDTLTLPAEPTRALILGNGGAAKAVAYTLHHRFNLPFDLAVRTLKPIIEPVFNPAGQTFTFDELDEKIIDNHRLIINTTPLGMYPDVETYPPLPYHALTPKHYLYDLVYNPALTPFLAQGKAQGTHITNGLAMLHAQAEAAFEIWQQYHDLQTLN